MRVSRCQRGTSRGRNHPANANARHAAHLRIRRRSGAPRQSTPVDRPITGFDLARTERAGYYVDTRDGAGQTLARVPARGAFSTSAEVFPEQPGEPITRVEVAQPKGAFTVVVPAPSGADSRDVVRVAAGAPGAVQPAARATSVAARRRSRSPTSPSFRLHDQPARRENDMTTADGTVTRQHARSSAVRRAIARSTSCCWRTASPPRSRTTSTPRARRSSPRSSARRRSTS